MWKIKITFYVNRVHPRNTKILARQILANQMEKILVKFCQIVSNGVVIKEPHHFAKYSDIFTINGKIVTLRALAVAVTCLNIMVSVRKLLLKRKIPRCPGKSSI